MSAFEKAMLSLTGAFLLLCAAILLLKTSAASVTCEGCTAYIADESGAGARTIREKLDAVLGLADAPVSTSGRLDINAATAEELAALPGIGETRAARIVRYRTYNGPFGDAAHLCDVTGIGDGLYAKIADLIYAGT